MKRLTALVLILVCVFSIVGCKQQVKSGWKATLSNGNSVSEELIIGTALNKNKITDTSEGRFPIFKMDSKSDLENFKNDYVSLSMGIIQKDLPSFQDATASCDDAFFENNSLLVIYIESGSGSFRYAVSSVYCDNEQACVYIKQTNKQGELVTCDLAHFFMIVEIEKSLISECNYFDAKFDNGKK